jgi:hypothetical protein
VTALTPQERAAGRSTVVRAEDQLWAQVPSAVWRRLPTFGLIASDGGWLRGRAGAGLAVPAVALALGLGRGGWRPEGEWTYGYSTAWLCLMLAIALAGAGVGA